METEVKNYWYIGLPQEGGSTLFYSTQNRSWTIWRRDASAWLSEFVAEGNLKDNIQRGNVPSNAKVVGVRQTVEEIK